MKKVIVLFIFLLSANGIQAQENVISEPNNKEITHLANNFYKAVFTTDDGKVLQQGMYLRSDDARFLPHGVWTLYAYNSGEVITKAKYNKGTQVWVETIVDGKKLRVNEKQLRIKRLKHRISLLENQIADIQSD